MAGSKLPHADDYRRLGHALRLLRRRAGMTQREAASTVGIRSEFVSEVERGNRGLRWHMLVALVNAYRSSLAELAKEIERGD